MLDLNLPGELLQLYTKRPLHTAAKIGLCLYQNASAKHVKRRRNKQGEHGTKWLIIAPTKRMGDTIDILMLNTNHRGFVVRFHKSLVVMFVARVASFYKEVTLCAKSVLDRTRSENLERAFRFDGTVQESFPSSRRTYPRQAHPHLSLMIQTAPIDVLRAYSRLNPTNPTIKDVRSSLESLLYLFCYVCSVLSFDGSRPYLNLYRGATLFGDHKIAMKDMHRLGTLKESTGRSKKEFTRKVISHFTTSFTVCELAAEKLWDMAFVTDRLPGYEKTALRRRKEIAPSVMRPGEWTLYSVFEFMDAETSRIQRHSVYDEMYRAQMKERGGPATKLYTLPNCEFYHDVYMKNVVAAKTKRQQTSGSARETVGSDASDIGNVARDFPDDTEVQLTGVPCLKCENPWCRRVFLMSSHNEVMMRTVKVENYNRSKGGLCPS